MFFYLDKNKFIFELSNTILRRAAKGRKRAQNYELAES